MLLSVLSVFHLSIYAAGEDLPDLKAVYEKEAVKIEDAYQRSLKYALSEYGRDLHALEGHYKKAGDLNATLAMKKELARFDSDKSVPDEPPATLLGPAKKAQAAYHQRVKDAGTDRAKQLWLLTGNYRKRLDAMKKTLVSQDKLEEAVAVDSEMKRVKFIVAEVELILSKPTPRPVPNEKKPAIRRPLRTHRPGDGMTMELGDGVGMEFVWVPPGSFMMGRPDDEVGRPDCEGPVHKVTITKGFWIGSYEVKQEQYEQVTGKTPSRFKGDENPVEQVSWRDAAMFCEILTKGLGKALPLRLRGDIRAVRLPTEAEWEYACRAGTRTPFHTGDNESDLSKAGWWKGNAGGRTHPVGGKRRNAWGLYDMHGNVLEWCGDWLNEHYYRSSPGADPRGPYAGSDRVVRGGSWRTDARHCRVDTRSWRPPGKSCHNVGFRVVLATGRW